MLFLSHEKKTSPDFDPTKGILYHNLQLNNKVSIWTGLEDTVCVILY